MKLGQQMKLAPRMIQSMEILQMPLAELEERIEQELENNVALELAEGERTAQEIKQERTEVERDARELERPLKVDDGSASSDFERLESFESTHPDAAENEFSASDYEPRSADRFDDGESYGRARNDGERDGKMDAMAAAPARSASLTEQLLDQWALVEVEPAIRIPGEAIISFLDDDGYLRTPLETIADRSPPAAPEPGAAPARLTVEQLEKALPAVQLFLEPPGIAARDARECLLLQLDALPEVSDDGGVIAGPEQIAQARVLVDRHLEDLSKNRLPRIAESTGMSLDQIRDALGVIRKLSVAPARRLVNESVKPIIPDAIVEYDAEEDRYIAYLNDARMPNLRVNQEYALMAKDRGVEKKDREFLKTNLSNAQWLIDAVNQRKHTLLRVVNAVVQAQREYFDYGPQALKPLPMTLVADQLGIHVATVSRAVADKYIQTPRGVVPLRKFFSGGVQTDSGEEVAWDAIKVALKEVIDAEDKSKPLSDEALAEELKKRGLEIARRTVAKYRDQLNIPSARMRKTF
ncbi:MAG: RNA polymerase factor sigma-54 [Phycisphaerales bacterium]|nr:RNA polymerase factor sigma-54 [Phycisphaerales bacterium]